MSEGTRATALNQNLISELKLLNHIPRSKPKPPPSTSGGRSRRDRYFASSACPKCIDT